jgi:hypothetical protein
MVGRAGPIPLPFLADASALGILLIFIFINIGRREILKVSTNHNLAMYVDREKKSEVLDDLIIFFYYCKYLYVITM